MKDIKKYIRECFVYQAAMNELVAYPCLLQPIPIPTEVWQDISMALLLDYPNLVAKMLSLWLKVDLAKVFTLWL